jgi:hypothetical protein
VQIDGYDGLEGVYVDNPKTTTGKWKHKIVTRVPGGVWVKEDAYHFMANITKTLHKQHPLYRRFQQRLSAAIFTVYKKDSDAIIKQHPNLSTQELAGKIAKLARRGIPDGKIVWQRLLSLMREFQQCAVSNGLSLFTATTCPTILGQRDLVVTQNGLTGTAVPLLLFCMPVPLELPLVVLSVCNLCF